MPQFIKGELLKILCAECVFSSVKWEKAITVKWYCEKKYALVGFVIFDYETGIA